MFLEMCQMSRFTGSSQREINGISEQIRVNNESEVYRKDGAVARDRTVDLVINSHTLYRLSYNGLESVNNPRYINLSPGSFLTGSGTETVISRMFLCGPR